jgi:hypothetical protein
MHSEPEPTPLPGWSRLAFACPLCEVVDALDAGALPSASGRLFRRLPLTSRKQTSHADDRRCGETFVTARTLLLPRFLSSAGLQDGFLVILAGV